MTWASMPSPWRRPAHSRAMYPPPMHSVLPGALGREKRSSEEI
eukprot:CAMPEP_0185177714 /NCGR_PEP_ID=MMETSP1139-20130426/30101_1 /TAXON_ID=298111 /ORGANISM="Pavlova sp., Strain CCMP459" /LENGTH=42 /DNA_ID= /DNA_START= /DNA_END= /DNA_ORIENTATION=